MTRVTFFYGWRVVLALALANFTMYLGAGQGSLSVFYRALLDEFDWSRGAVATIGTLILLLPAGLVYFVGRTCDRRGARPVCLLAILSASAGFFVAASASSLGQMYVFSLFLAVGECGLGFVPTQVLVSRWFGRRRGLATGIATAGISLAGILGPLLVNGIIERHGWRAAFAACGLLCLLVSTPAVLLWIRSRPSDLGMEAEPASEAGSAPIEAGGLGLAEAARTRTFPALILCSTGIFYALYAVAQHWVLLLTDQGLTRATAASLLTVYYAMGFVGRFVWGPLLDRFSKKAVALVMTVTMASMVALVAIAHGVPAVFYVYAVVFGFCYGGFIFTVPLLTAEFFGTRRLGEILGASSAAMTTLSSLSPAVTGFLFDRSGSYRLPLLVAAAAAALAAASLLLARDERGYSSSTLR